MMKLIFLGFFYVSSIFGADCTPEYSTAVSNINSNPKRAITLLQQIIARGEADCGELLVGRAYLQIANTYRMKLMEPWEALKYLEAFIALPYSDSHPSKPWAIEKRDFILHYKTILDGLQKQFDAETDPNKKVDIKIEMGRTYMSGLDAPMWAFKQFKEAFVLSGETSDLAYYLMGHSYLEYGDDGNALKIFNDFLIRFTKSAHRLGAFSWAFELEYNKVMAMTNASRRSYYGKILIKRIEDSFVEFPAMPESFKNKFDWYIAELKKVTGP